MEDFCECIFPRNSFEVEKVLEAIRQNKVSYGTMQQTADKLGIDQNKFHAILRRLKDLGIVTGTYTFSEIFQNKIAAIGSFYGKYTGKANPVQKALDDANDYLRTKGYSGSFEPRFNTEEDDQKQGKD